jgi:hypothetical protein
VLFFIVGFEEEHRVEVGVEGVHGVEVVFEEVHGVEVVLEDEQLVDEVFVLLHLVVNEVQGLVEEEDLV